MYLELLNLGFCEAYVVHTVEAKHAEHVMSHALLVPITARRDRATVYRGHSTHDAHKDSKRQTTNHLSAAPRYEKRFLEVTGL